MTKYCVVYLQNIVVLHLSYITLKIPLQFTYFEPPSAIFHIVVMVIEVNWCEGYNAI